MLQAPIIEDDDIVERLRYAAARIEVSDRLTANLLTEAARTIALLAAYAERVEEREFSAMVTAGSA